MLAPYKALRSHATSSKCIAIDFDKSPPHFQFLRFLCVGDIGLAALTTATLFANVLTVVLAGLFSPSTAEFGTPIDVETFRLPTIGAGIRFPEWDMYYALDADISRNGTTKWTTDDLYIIPFHPVDNEALVTYTGPTIALGANITCSVDRTNNVPTFCSTQEDMEFPCQRGDLSPVVKDPCFHPGDLYFLLTPPSDDRIIVSDDCPGTFLAAWMEIPGDPAPEDLEFPNKDAFDIVVLTCRAHDVAYELIAIVNEVQEV